MPLTHFPNGLSSDKDDVQIVKFASASAGATVYAYVPYDATITNFTFVGDTGSRVAAYTAKIGSAGTTLVNGISNTTGVAGVTEDLTIASATVEAGDSISVARGNQGSTGATSIAITLKRR